MKTISYILAALLIAAIGYIGYLNMNPQVKEVYIKAKPLPAQIVTVTKDQKTTIIKDADPADKPEATLSKERWDYIEKEVLPALAEGAKYKAQVEEITAINAQLKGELAKKEVQMQQVERDVIRWKSKYIEIAANTKDSTVNYTYNADLTVTKYNQKQSLFSPRESYVAITSADKNLRINSVERYVQKVKPDADLLEINGTAGAFYTDKIFPYGAFEARFFPDGRVVPFVNYGYYLNGKWLPFYGAGVTYNIIRF